MSSPGRTLMCGEEIFPNKKSWFVAVQIKPANPRCAGTGAHPLRGTVTVPQRPWSVGKPLHSTNWSDGSDSVRYSREGRDVREWEREHGEQQRW